MTPPRILTTRRRVFVAVVLVWLLSAAVALLIGQLLPEHTPWPLALAAGIVCGLWARVITSRMKARWRDWLRDEIQRQLSTSDIRIYVGGVIKRDVQ